MTAKSIGITPELARNVYAQLERDVGSSEAAQEKRLREILTAIVEDLKV